MPKKDSNESELCMTIAGVIVMILLLLRWSETMVISVRRPLSHAVHSDALHSALSRSCSVCKVSHVRCAVAANRNGIV